MYLPGLINNGKYSVYQTIKKLHNSSRVIRPKLFYIGVTPNDRQGISNNLTLCDRNHRWPVDSSHKEPATRKMFPFDGVMM